MVHPAAMVPSPRAAIPYGRIESARGLDRDDPMMTARLKEISDSPA
jgi:hypothetical protein